MDDSTRYEGVATASPSVQPLAHASTAASHKPLNDARGEGGDRGGVDCACSPRSMVRAPQSPAPWRGTSAVWY